MTDSIEMSKFSKKILDTSSKTFRKPSQALSEKAKKKFVRQMTRKLAKKQHDVMFSFERQSKTLKQKVHDIVPHNPFAPEHDACRCAECIEAITSEQVHAIVLNDWCFKHMDYMCYLCCSDKHGSDDVYDYYYD